MITNIEFPTSESTAKQKTKKNDRSFHMDRGKIVCNGCGGHFPNLVLFENHTHKDGSLIANLPSKKSGPKTEHKTFNNISDEEMMEAFHKLPELKGCYYKNGSFYCCMCGKGFRNPYVLFSHRIIHPPDMKPAPPKAAPGIQTQTPRVRYICSKNERVKVVVPTVYENVDSEKESDEESKPGGVPRVTKAVLKVAKDSSDQVDEALPITFGSQEMVQVPWVPVAELGKKKPGAGSGTTTYIYKMLGSRSERSTFVNINKTKNMDVDKKNIVMVSPKQGPAKEGEKSATKSGTEKGLVFTDLDEEKMEKVFKTLPGLQKCRVLKDGTFQCDRCIRSFANPYLLFSHRLLHNNVLEDQVAPSTSNNDIGPEPKLVFYSLPGLNKCKMVDGEYYCNVCPEKFSNPYLLFTHKMSHDNNDTKDTTSQGVIEIKENSAFGNIFGQNGLAHCKIEKGKYYCDRCSRVFTNPYLLLNHKLLHEKKEDGGKDVATTSSSAQTAITYSDEDSDSEMDSEDDDICYECNLCQVQFESLDGLASHIEAHTRNTDEEETDGISKGSEETGGISKRSEETDGISERSEETDGISERSEQTDGISKRSEETVGSYGSGRKRIIQNTESKYAHDTGNTGADTAPKVKVIKQEHVKVYPGEVADVQCLSPKSTNALHEETPGTSRRIKIKVELVAPKPDSSKQFVKGTVKTETFQAENSLLKVRLAPVRRKPFSMLKRAVVRLERLDIKPNQVCILK